MTLAQLVRPKMLAVSLLTVVLAVVGGMVVATSQHPTPAQLLVQRLDARTAGNVAQAHASSGKAMTTTRMTSGMVSVSHPPVSTPVASADPSTAANTQTDSASSPANSSAPVVVAVSATLDPYTTPVAGVDLGTNRPYQISYEYCTFAYSDGTTKDVLVDTKKVYADGTITDAGTELSCILANAPTAH